MGGTIAKYVQPAVSRYLQPADVIVERPPLDWKLVWRLCSIAACSWVIVVVAIGVFTFLEAHSLVERPLKTCDISSKDSSCTETTLYPKQLQVSLSPWASVEVTLNGPSRLRHSQIEDAIRGMTCEVNSSDGTLLYTSWGNPIPLIFERTCTDQRMPLLSLRPIGDKHGFSNVFDHIEGLKILKDKERHRNFVLSDFIIQRVQWPGFGWAGIAGAGLFFEDGFKLDSWTIANCASSEQQYELDRMIARDCGRGTPFLGGSVYSHVQPTICPLDNTTSHWQAYEFYLKLISDPSLRAYHTQVTEDKSIMDIFAAEICQGLSISGIDMLIELERNNPIGNRSGDELLKIIVQSIDKQCPYTFVCDESQFQGLFIWIAIAYPFYLVAFKVFEKITRSMYGKLHRQPSKTQLGKQPCEDAKKNESEADSKTDDVIARCSPVEGLRNFPGTGLHGAIPDYIAEVVNIAVKEAASKLEQRLVLVETSLERFQTEISSKEIQRRSGPEHEKEPIFSTCPVDANSPNGRAIGSRLDALLPQLAETSSSFRPSSSKEGVFLKELVESLMHEVQQTWRSELNLAIRSCNEEVLKLESRLVRSPHQGVAIQRTQLNDIHGNSTATENIVSSRLPIEARHHHEDFQQNLQCGANHPFQQPCANLGVDRNQALPPLANSDAPEVYAI